MIHYPLPTILSPRTQRKSGLSLLHAGNADFLARFAILARENHSLRLMSVRRRRVFHGR
jgi:hypothetical protein